MSLKKLVLLLFILFIILILRFSFFYQENLPYKGGQEISLTTTLQQEPTPGNSGQKFTIKTQTNQLISVTADKIPQLHYGQVIVISGQLQEDTFADGSTILRLFHPHIVLERQADNSIAAVANAIKSRTEILYDDALPQVSANLLMGMVFGANEKFPNNFRQALQTTGVLHVIAASGMNVTFVSAALLYTLGFFLQRRVALVVGALGIIFYVFLVGFQPSILRASVMGLLAFGAGFLGRQNIGWVAVLVSGYLLLLWQPNFLFDVGFQLSFLATLGILFLKPLLDEPLLRLGKVGELGGEAITTTLAAQLGTLPVLLGVFGQIGLLSVLVNALVLWTVPIVMILGSLAAIVGLLFPFLGELLLYPALPFLVFFESIVMYFGQSDLVIHTASLPAIVWVVYYFLLASWIFFQKRKVSLKTDPVH